MRGQQRDCAELRCQVLTSHLIHATPCRRLEQRCGFDASAMHSMQGISWHRMALGCLGGLRCERSSAGSWSVRCSEPGRLDLSLLYMQSAPAQHALQASSDLRGLIFVEYMHAGCNATCMSCSAGSAACELGQVHTWLGHVNSGIPCNAPVRQHGPEAPIVVLPHKYVLGLDTAGTHTFSEALADAEPGAGCRLPFTTAALLAHCA